jgi:glutathione S-transferase
MAPAMKLYNTDLSPNALRVRAVAAELGIALELVEVDLRDAAAKVAALAPVNPNTKVPVLVDGDFVLWESRAINGYLASMKPEKRLYPTEPKARAVVDQWSWWHGIHLGPAMNRVNFERFLKPRFGMGEPDEAAIAGEVREVERLLPILDTRLRGREWVGDGLSLADFAIATTFHYRDVAGISLAATPAVAGWIARLEARPSWQAAAAPIWAFIAG